MSSLFDAVHRIGCECIDCRPEEYLTRYTRPEAPFQPTSDTSERAAELVDVRRNQRVVVNTLKLAGRGGLTREQIAQKSGLRLSSVCSAVNALKDKRTPPVLVATGETRLTSAEREAEVVTLAEEYR